MSAGAVNWFPGHMRKALTQMTARVNSVDLFMEVRDARLPYSSRNPEFEELIRGAQKPKLLIFNKYDLCDRVVTDQVMGDYRRLGIECYAVSTKQHEDMRALLGSVGRAHQAKYRRVGLWSMICGLPNVGKSTLINQLRGVSDLENKTAAARATASVATTRGLSGFKILEKPLMFLVDTPGVMVPSVLPH